MKIDSLHFRNFKLLHDVDINPGNVNVIIGANGSGKSTVLEAIGLLSLAMTDRINDSTLKNKGIRLSTPSGYKSSFETYRKSATIGIQMEWEDTHSYRYAVDLNTPSEQHEWRYHSEILYVDNNKVWGRSGRSEVSYDDSIGMLMLDNNESFHEARQSIDWMKSYAIYQPSTPVLRSVLQESEPQMPLGLNGGRLAESIEELLHEEDDEVFLGSIPLDEILDLIDWADGLSVSYPNKRNTNPFVTSARRVIEFHDSFMKQKDRFTGYDASEGALYVWLYCKNWWKIKSLSYKACAHRAHPDVTGLATFPRLQPKPGHKGPDFTPFLFHQILQLSLMFCFWLVLHFIQRHLAFLRWTILINHLIRG